MALAQEDIDQIQQLIKKSISETPEVVNANVRYELDLRERTNKSRGRAKASKRINAHRVCTNGKAV